jgi:L-2,4-diaminobutyrate decarboxylase
MQNIKKVQALFTQPMGEEDKILKILQKLLSAIDEKKHGTFIGKKKTIDYERLFYQASFPRQMSSEDDVIESIIRLYDGVGLWAHPQMQVNVIPPPTTISIAAETLAARYNENSIWDHYGVSASQSEVLVIGMLADLIGFDKTKVGGIFTFGGTGCNLYAARIGIEKADPDAKHTGIRDRIHFFCSDVSHYSIKSAAIWTGVGLNHVKVIPSDSDNIMDVTELEKAMNETIASGARIGTVFATMGTTDAFGIDPLKEIVKLRDKIQKRVGYKIHIHADAVIGWPFLTFQGDKSIKHLPLPLQKKLMSIVSKITELQYADSVGIDFHKTGWAPYLCSAFVVKDKEDLFMLQKLKKEMPYLYHGSGYQPGIFTLESSRPNYAQKALVNIMVLGKEGYETLIVHLLTMADYLREKIEASKEIALLNRHNPAFVTDFRIYPETKYDKMGLLFEKELNDLTSEEFTRKINLYNQEIAQCMIEEAETKGTSMVSYTDSYKTTREGRIIVAIKSYPMSPFVDKEHMDELLKDLYRAKEYVDRKKVKSFKIH